MPTPRLYFRSVVASLLTLFASVFLSLSVFAVEPATERALNSEFEQDVLPFLKKYCHDCHGESLQEAKLDLSPFNSVASVSEHHSLWEILLRRVEAGEMPPEDSGETPSPGERANVVRWVKSLRAFDANRNAGDPGAVIARRLSNREYDYTIRDLTGVDIRPSRTFPVDPANESGFDNTGESLTMSPALLKKYVAAAREVSDHLVFTPDGLTFAPHPVVTDTDRDKYCVKRIVAFYNEQPTDLALYFKACWLAAKRSQSKDLSAIAADLGISLRYAEIVQAALARENAQGPLKAVQEKFDSIPETSTPDQLDQQCAAIRAYIGEIRPLLAYQFNNLEIKEVHRGAQPFVLWKNDQYATHRRKLDHSRLIPADKAPETPPHPELIVPAEEQLQAAFKASVEEFCSVFPDAFFISERGRDYLNVPKEKQEKGRLLSAGFHSMMGYYRDDAPLYELILNEKQRQHLDRLWGELDFFTSAPSRQYVGFLWFERTDSRYMRDPEFDFARPENKQSGSEEMIRKLSELYLAKAKRNGGTEVPLKAIEDYFSNINRQIRWVEAERLKAESVHLENLQNLMQQAWRRPLSTEEREDLDAFYHSLRTESELGHEEAIRDCLVSIFMSPHFLYRLDLVSSGDGTRPLTKAELANRLSYFLWSSQPDQSLHQSLSEASSQPELADTLRRQSRRMLQNGKARALATEFAANWLDIRRFEEHNSVDRDRFPQFTDELRSAMFEEPMQFFLDVVQHDRSILTLFEADHTFVNPVLAKHYGIEGLDFSETEWVRVDNATQHARGGLLPMSVFLTKNAPGLRTSPVKRGYWVARYLLGERIPPPPPNVPELPADESQLGELSLREMLARHRDHKSCASCHNRIDSLGVAFEGFGPVGERRAIDLGGREVETETTFPDGTPGNGLAGLKRYLREHRQQDFIDNFSRKLLSYALSRSLILSDEALIIEMKSQLAENDYRFSSLAETIITSPQFLNKRGSDYLLGEK